MRIRVNYPRDQFDGNADYVTDQDWGLLTYNLVTGFSSSKR